MILCVYRVCFCEKQKYFVSSLKNILLFNLIQKVSIRGHRYSVFPFTLRHRGFLVTEQTPAPCQGLRTPGPPHAAPCPCAVRGRVCPARTAGFPTSWMTRTPFPDPEICEPAHGGKLRQHFPRFLRLSLHELVNAVYNVKAKILCLSFCFFF